MKSPITKWHCPYCDKAWTTEEDAKACAKFPYDVLKEGDVLDWHEYRYGLVQNVHDEKDWAGFSAYKNTDYCVALGYSPKDAFGLSTDGACYAGLLCGGKDRHERLLFPQAKIDDLVTSLEKRLKAAKRLQVQVQTMWKNRGQNGKSEREKSEVVCDRTKSKSKAKSKIGSVTGGTKAKSTTKKGK